jgi:hypothetical protein
VSEGDNDATARQNALMRTEPVRRVERVTVLDMDFRLPKPVNVAESAHGRRRELHPKVMEA